MRHKKIPIALLILMVLCVSLWMMMGKASILETGTPYKFRTAPVDPSDPFGGPYIRLDFEDVNLPTDRLHGNSSQRDEIYVTLSVDSLGFARPSAAYDAPPVPQRIIS